MINISNVKKRFGKVDVLNGLNLELASKGVIAILGPNGSGKTTLIKSVLGMVLPQSGTITFDGIDTKSQWSFRNKISYLPQIARFPENITVTELFDLIVSIRSGSENRESLIELFGLTPFLNKKLGNLSGGTRQKVNIIIAFMFDSPVFILDEPTAGLDPVSLIHLKELIQKEKEKGKIIIITTHIMSLVEDIADEIVFLLEGEIYFRGSVLALKEETGESDLEHAIANILRK
ncbi:MAG: ABC transporter ATP-binding protein [Cyclobacteriaceae bacterium]|nr:ABC transporter ATP-binding protein [Cyclobacteriaceae bacterium]